jgi:hypothetical protein
MKQCHRLLTALLIHAGWPGRLQSENPQVVEVMRKSLGASRLQEHERFAAEEVLAESALRGDVGRRAGPSSPPHAVAAGESRPDSSGRPLSSHSCLPPAYTATSV